MEPETGQNWASTHSFHPFILGLGHLGQQVTY